MVERVVLGDPNVYPNYANYLLYGILMCVILMVSYLIIESKKSFSKDWPIDEIQKRIEEDEKKLKIGVFIAFLEIYRKHI